MLADEVMRELKAHMVAAMRSRGCDAGGSERKMMLKSVGLGTLSTELENGLIPSALLFVLPAGLERVARRWALRLRYQRAAQATISHGK